MPVSVLKRRSSDSCVGAISAEGQAGHCAERRQPHVGIAIRRDRHSGRDLLARALRGDVAADLPEAGTSGIRTVAEVGEVARSPDERVVGVESGEAQRHPGRQALDSEQRPVEELGRVGLGVLTEAGERARVLRHVVGRDERGAQHGAAGVIAARQVRSDEEPTGSRHGEQDCRVTARVVRPAPFWSDGRLRLLRSAAQPMATRAKTAPWTATAAGVSVPRTIEATSRPTGATRAASAPAQRRATPYVRAPPTRPKRKGKARYGPSESTGGRAVSSSFHPGTAAWAERRQRLTRGQHAGDEVLPHRRRARQHEVGRRESQGVPRPYHRRSPPRGSRAGRRAVPPGRPRASPARGRSSGSR